MNYRILSYPLNEKSPLYGNTPKPIINPHSQISRGDSSNTYTIELHNHSGTHIDAPKHFIDEEKCISDYSIDELVFSRPLILNCLKGPEELVQIEDIHVRKLKNIDCIFFRTGFGKYRHKNEIIYRKHNPGISSELIFWLRMEFPEIRCIGIDSISISSFQNRLEGRNAHRMAFIDELGEPLLVIEDMNLDILSFHDKLEKVIIVPWQISGIDSAPCTVFAEVS